MVGSRVANSRSLGQDLGLGQTVEQGRLAGIGVADQCDHRERDALAGAALQAASALHAFELGLDLDDALADQPAVGLDLRPRPDRRGSRSRRAGARDGSRTAPAAGSADRSGARARPAAGPRGSARVRRRSPGSARCGRAPWCSMLSPDCAAGSGESWALTIDDFGHEKAQHGRDLFDLAAADQRRGHGRDSGAMRLAITFSPIAAVSPMLLRDAPARRGRARPCAIRLDMEHEGGVRTLVRGLGGQAVSATVSASMSWIGPAA